MDDNYRTPLVKTHEARDAIDALLAQREVAVKHSGVFGCSTKWKEKQQARLEALRKSNLCRFNSSRLQLRT